MARLLPLYSIVSHAKIERRARELYESLGCPPNRDLDHWLRAEQEFLQSCHAVPWQDPGQIIRRASEDPR